MASDRDDGFTQAVREAVDIVEVVSEYTELEQKGQRYKGLCPFHKEKTPSFSCDRDRGLYYCFGCGAGGDAIKFHMELTGDDFPTALESLARRFGVPVPQRRGPGPQVLAASRVLEAAEEFFVRQLERSPGPLRYLEQRQIGLEIREQLRIGFAPDAWTQMLDSLQGRFPPADLERVGLVGRSQKSGRLYDRFRNRLMFSIRGTSGRLVGFGGRTLGDDPAKYINTAETESFNKSQILYGLHRARPKIREAGRVLLVEGYFDVAGAVLSGVDWTVASMGTALTEQQAKLLARYADEVIVGYDGDRAGEEASRKALRMLLAQGLSVRRARFPAGQDPDSLRLEEGPEVVRETVDGAVDAIDLELGRVTPQALADPRLRSAHAAELADLLQAIPDEVLRYAYGERAASALGLPTPVFWQSAERNGRERPRRWTRGPTNSGEELAPRVDRGGAGNGTAVLHSSIEDQVLARLLWFGADVERLPSPEVFQDADRRDLYRVVQEALSTGEVQSAADEQGQPRPVCDVDVVWQSLPAASAAVDLLARLLAEPAAVPDGRSVEEELEHLLATLSRKSALVRQRALQAEIAQAQARGDAERVQELAGEIRRLSLQRLGRS